MTPARLVWLAAAAFASVFGTLAILRHRTFESGRFDLGNMTQAVWSTANGDVLSVTDVHGEQILRLGSHFDPILAALAPLWWVWPSPEALLVLQAVALAAGAIPLYLLARRHLPEWPAAAIACAYLLFPPVQWLTVSDFHPVALATPLLLAAWYFLDAGRLWPFALFAAAAVTTKEHVGLAVAGLGVWYALDRGERRTGTVIAVVAGAAALVAALVVVPSFAPAGGAFVSRYEDPSLDWRDLGYVLRLLLPLALTPLGAAAALLPAVPELMLNAFSSTRTQTSVQTHYAATIAPALLVQRCSRSGGSASGPPSSCSRRLSPAPSCSARSGGPRLEPTRTMPPCAVRSRSCPTTQPSAPRTRSARTSPRVSGSSASRSCSGPTGLRSTRRA